MEATFKKIEHDLDQINQVVTIWYRQGIVGNLVFIW